MVANLKKIKAEAEGQRYTTLGTFWADYVVCNKMSLEITCLSNIIYVMCLILRVPISFGLPVQNIWALVPTSENLCYHWSAMINIHEQRLFGNLQDIYFAYYMYTYADWFTEDGNINFYFYPLCHYPAGTRPHLLQVQLLWIKPQPVLEFGKKSCSVVHLLFPLDLIWNIGKTLIKLRLHRL